MQKCPTLKAMKAAPLAELRTLARECIPPGAIWKPCVVADRTMPNEWIWRDTESSDWGNGFKNERAALIAGVRHCWTE